MSSTRTMTHGIPCTRFSIVLWKIPDVITHQGEFTEDMTAECRRKWISAISRDDLTDSILKTDRVCSKHFVSGQAAKDGDRYNVDRVPTLCLGHSKNN